MSSADISTSFNLDEMIKRKLTLEQLNECREAFGMYDDDNDGIISTKELKPALRALGYNPNSVVLDKIKAIDDESEDGEGRLEYEDFLNLVCQQIRYSFTSKDMLEDFEAIDVNKDGKISQLELRNYLDSLRMPFSVEEIDEIVYTADLDNDGTIDYKEFVIMMCPDKREEEK